MYTKLIRSYVRAFSSNSPTNWAKLAIEQALERLKEREESLEVERKYHREVRIRLAFSNEIFYVYGTTSICVERSNSRLDEYKILHKIPEAGENATAPAPNQAPSLPGLSSELAVVESEHTITEIAALEAVFCALKNEGCFRIPLKLYFNK
ncbi:hypothetical protein EDB87DRAFT_1573825 [Lactarius vividus]|nr:hypothetical protein EDB87DRAFT_1573825 [Lactarius vividus]